MQTFRFHGETCAEPAFRFLGGIIAPSGQAFRFHGGIIAAFSPRCDALLRRRRLRGVDPLNDISVYGSGLEILGRRRSPKLDFSSHVLQETFCRHEGVRTVILLNPSWKSRFRSALSFLLALVSSFVAGPIEFERKVCLCRRSQSSWSRKCSSLYPHHFRISQYSHLYLCA